MKLEIQKILIAQTALRELTNIPAKELPSADFGMRAFRASRSVRSGLAAYNDYLESAQKRIDELKKAEEGSDKAKSVSKAIAEEEKVLSEMRKTETEINPPTFSMTELGYGDDGKPLVSVACLLDLQSAGIVVEG